MRRLRALWMRLMRARRTRLDFDDELESHLRLHIEEGVRAGLREGEARRQALIRLGGAEQARQAYGERAGLPLIETVAQDVRYALRGFRHSPAFAITAILTLALGIGATTAVFSVVDRILFRPLPYAHPDQLVSVGLTAPIIPQEFMLGGSYFVWRDNQKPFSRFTSETGVNACDLTENNPAHLNCASVEANFLPTLGVSPMLGPQFSSRRRQAEGIEGGLDFVCALERPLQPRSGDCEQAHRYRRSSGARYRSAARGFRDARNGDDGCDGSAGTGRGGTAQG